MSKTTQLDSNLGVMVWKGARKWHSARPMDLFTEKNESGIHSWQGILLAALILLFCSGMPWGYAGSNEFSLHSAKQDKGLENPFFAPTPRKDSSDCRLCF